MSYVCVDSARTAGVDSACQLVGKGGASTRSNHEEVIMKIVPGRSLVHVIESRLCHRQARTCSVRTHVNLTVGLETQLLLLHRPEVTLRSYASVESRSYMAVLIG
jgi:hypothetical protein